MRGSTKRPRLSIGRILSAAFALLMVLLAVFLAGVLVGRQPPLAGTPIPYAKFEESVRKGLFLEATVDGNIIVASYRAGDRQAARAIAPQAGRAVDLLLEHGVSVEAARPVPASGLTAPMAVALLLPYLILAWFGLAVARAAAGAPELPPPEPVREPPPEDVLPSRPLPPTLTEGP